MWATMGVGSPAYERYRDHGLGAIFSIGTLVGAVVMFPFCLWLGYWWGRVMAASAGARASSRAA